MNSRYSLRPLTGINNTSRRKYNTIRFMKKLFLFCAFISVAMFCACTEADNVVPGEGPETPQTPDTPVETPEIPVVPIGFGWSTLAHVNLTLEAEVDADVSIYSEADCRGNSLLVENGALEANVARTFALAVPAGATDLYVKYDAPSGEADPLRLAINTAGDGTDDVSYKFPTDAVKSRYQKVENYQYYYNSGVIMVEDMWPNFAGSDADFNDLVLEYDLKTAECTSPGMLPAHGYKEGLIITLDVRGVGSGQTRKAGLQLDFDTSLIQSVTTEVQAKAGQGKYEVITDNRFTIQVDKTQPDKLLILFDGLDNLVQGKHYQTTKGEIVEGQPMIRAYIKISGAPDRSALTGEASRAQAEAFRDVTSYPEKHDFFMVLKSGVEIHQKGFAPSYRYKNYDADSKGLMSDVPYCSVNNDVWVLRLPVGTPHAYDRVSMFSAYPDLKEWIESNGQQKRDWYKNYNHDLVPRYW